MEQRKSTKLNFQQESQLLHHNNHIPASHITKLLDPDASWDKDQLADVLHWIRQALALIFGLIWGVVPLVGGIWFLLFVVLSTGIIYAYYAIVLKVDEEDFGGHVALLQEGLFASVSLFLLAWILVYSLGHF
ncbi:Rab5-interacting family protein [Dorcoceras hygrometricum]|uniref:Rab5-interacting family protein n=1 Tax=Dorcoceras hygrometricum TaxID=472368 RepID=A0A2Z7B368_9LAMI|nr:Rab5-interacting family protein [Dorcoceras hygrometricum]